MTRRFADGDCIEIDGLRFRVVPGYKSPADLRLDCCVEGRWQAVHMRLGAFMADFFFENEHVLYPPPKYRGGWRYLGYLRDAATLGWERAEAELRDESREKQLREAAKPDQLDLLSGFGLTG